MFPRPTDILKAREGSLSETPLPLLLHALHLEERSCALELKLRGLEKRILIEDGAPVGASSNLLHETLGKYLVAKGKLTEQQYQDALVESVQTGARMGELLVQRQLITPFELYKQLQANLAAKVLDSFRWGEASYRILGDAPSAETPVKMNAAQLILTGCSGFLPFEVLATHLPFVDEQRFALVPQPPHETASLKLSPKDARMFQVLRGRPTFAELLAGTGLEMEEGFRRLFGFCVLGVVGFADEVDAMPAPSPSAPSPSSSPTLVPVAPVVPAKPTGLPFLDEDEQAKNAVVSAFMAVRTQDPFDVLGVPLNVELPALRKAFLELSNKMAPNRFETSDLREKAEAVLLAGARAYGLLSEHEQKLLYRRRREIAEEQKRNIKRQSTEEQFRIRTDLLDARSQFDEGKRRLQEGNFRGAVEYFGYALEIEPKPEYRAYVAWARYQVNPSAHARLALSELNEALRADPNNELAHGFAGEIHRAQGDFAGAEESFKAAFKANPRERKWADLTHEMARLKRTKR